MKSIFEVIKNNKWKSTIVLFLLIIVVFSVSYAAFYKSGEGTALSGSIGNLDIEYTDGETLNFSNSLPLLESEVLDFAPSYDFTVENTGNIPVYAEISLTNLSISSTLKSSGDFKWALYEGETKISEGNFQNSTTKQVLSNNILISVSTIKSYTIRVWINDNGGDQNSLLNQTMSGKINVTATDRVVATTFDYSGEIETYTISESGDYIIEAAGASGTTGNNFSYTAGAPLGGGKGATIKATFTLNSGDVLYIVSGGKGSITDATVKDGTSGAGGGGSFVFKKITSVTDSTYQITKGSEYLEVLLVAAGGGGSTDNSYKGTSALAGVDGVGATWISPGGTAYSTTTNAGTSSTSISSVLGISQFITYDSVGSYYTRGNGTCRGGFGGGSCTDDSQSYGGGWSGSSYTANSFSSGTDTSGTTGSRTGNGYVKISKK